jgi:3-dehydroshikimate dehydratase
MAARLVPGLCSVTLRAQRPAEVVATAVAGGLEVIEWGGDVHVPVGDTHRAMEVRRRTEDAGLRVCSYGSYFGRRGTFDDFAAVLATAQVLGAPRIRVWAGDRGSASIEPAPRARVVAALRMAAELARGAGVELAVEFHPDTLTDTAPSTLRLLDEVGAGLRTYWQPPVGAPDAETLTSLDAVLDHTVTVHVFSWWPARERLPLGARGQLWQQVADRLAAGSPRREVPMLLEFVPDDDPVGVLREAAALRCLIA